MHTIWISKKKLLFQALWILRLSCLSRIPFLSNSRKRFTVVSPFSQLPKRFGSFVSVVFSSFEVIKDERERSRRAALSWQIERNCF